MKVNILLAFYGRLSDLDSEVRDALHLIIGMIEEVGAKVDHLDKRLDNVENRLDNIENRLDNMENRLDNMEKDVKDIKGEMREMRKEQDHMNVKLDIHSQLYGRHEVAIQALEKKAI